MEQKPFGLLLEDVIGYSHQNVAIDNEVVSGCEKTFVVKGSLLTAMSQEEAKIKLVT